MLLKRVIAIAFVTLSGCTRSAPQKDVVSESLTFPRRPYMGVSCPTPNSTRCDRVGIRVWFDELPPVVDVSVNGRPIRLTRDERGKWVEGYLESAGLQREPLNLPEKWEGIPSVHMLVEIEAKDSGGRTRSFRDEVGLHAGWG
jgi:hypothetical protein